MSRAWLRAMIVCGGLALPMRPLAGESQPSMSGRLLCSRLTDGTWQVWQVDLASQMRHQVTFSQGDKRYPTWTPDGRIVYCTTNQACFHARPDEPSGGLLMDLWPIRDVARSPDGRSTAFSKFRTDLVDSANLWLADAGGATRRLLTHEPGIQQQAAWSPDGRRIAYSGGQGHGTYEIYVVGADGAERKQLTTNQSHDFLPAWSPDGTRIAFSSDRTGDYEIWLMRADGAEPQQLTRSPGLDTRPAWSPDGTQMAFATNRSGVLELWVMAADGSDQRLLERAEGGVCDPAWR